MKKKFTKLANWDGNIEFMHLGTWIYTLLNGKHVGTDQLGNRYYRGRGKQLNKRERRWVLYKSTPEASMVPAEWHAWLHHTVDEPLTEAAVKSRSWQRTSIPNPTGSSKAYRPIGHDYKGGQRRKVSGDYEAWTPD